MIPPMVMASQWRELYRPQTIDEMVGCPDFRADCEEWRDCGRYPAGLLFIGPSGTGKTTAAGVVARQMLGVYHGPINYVEFNASDDRGIDFVRNEVKTVAQQGGMGCKRKVVLFDEADGLTKQAQEAMKNTMEQCVEHSLFILTANDGSAIIPALQSRCMVYYFNKATDDAAVELFQHIDAHEGFPDTWLEHFAHLNQVCDGDLRSAVDILQSLPQTEDALTERLLVEQADFSNPAISIAAGEWNTLSQELRKIATKGLPRLHVMKQLRDSIYSLDISGDDYYSFLVVWGEFVERVFTWPAGDDAYYDYFVATLKDRTKEKNGVKNNGV